MGKIARGYFSAFFVLLLFVSLVSMAGCQNSDTRSAGDGVLIDQTVLDRRIGKIESLGSAVTSNQATHILRLQDGSNIYLSSTALDLNDIRYKGTSVEVSGVLNYISGNKPFMVVQNIDIIEDSFTQEAVAVSWKDYTHEKLAFGLRYRDDFKMKEDETLVQFSKPVADVSSDADTQASILNAREHVISITVTPHKPEESLLKHLGIAGNSTTDLVAAHFVKSKIGSDSLDALKKVSDDGKTIDFYFDRGSDFFHISFQGGNDAQSLDDQNIFYDTLSSFHLLTGASQDISVVDGTQQKSPDAITKPTLDFQSDTDASNSPIKSEDTKEVSDSPEINPPAPKPLPVPPSAPVVVPLSDKIPDSSALNTPTQETIPGFSAYSSPSYKFDLQYPKKWYFSAGTSTDSSVIKHYDFGMKPLEEEPGIVGLDILVGSLPGGTNVNYNGVPLVKVTSGDTVEFYVKGSKSRLYKVSGPSNQESALATMAASIKD